MKPVEVLLAELNELDVRLWRDGDRLRINAPKEVLTPDLRAELTARKAEILTFLDQKPPVAGSARPPIRPVSRAGTLPLSFALERLWFLSQLNPDSVGYNSPNAMRLIGPLDAAVLFRSLNEIVRRHEALRTTFTTTDGQPAQVIAPAQPDRGCTHFITG